MKQYCSSSIMCADWLNMQNAVDDLKAVKCDYIHCDVMDGHFVPNLMMPVDLINAIGSYTDIPLDIHLMAENPDYLINNLHIRENDIISVHSESDYHVERLLNLIRSKGARAFLALNPATPAEFIGPVISELDGVLIMTVNPGFSGQKKVCFAEDKIRTVRRYLEEHGYPEMDIEVDGNCSYENIKKFKDAGANIYVLGTSAVYKENLPLGEGMKAVRAILNE